MRSSLAHEARMEVTTDGNTRAWVRANQARLWRYARFLGLPAEDAEEVVQDAFLAALHKGAHRLAGDRGRAWLRGAVRNLARAKHRSGQRRPTLVVDPALDQVWLDREAGDDGASYRDALRTCLDQIDGADRKLVELRYADDLSRQDIAHRLELSVEALKSRLRRLKTRLRKCVELRLAKEER